MFTAFAVIMALTVAAAFIIQLVLNQYQSTVSLVPALGRTTPDTAYEVILNLRVLSSDCTNPSALPKSGLNRVETGQLALHGWEKLQANGYYACADDIITTATGFSESGIFTCSKATSDPPVSRGTASDCKITWTCLECQVVLGTGQVTASLDTSVIFNPFALSLNWTMSSTSYYNSQRFKLSGWVHPGAGRLLKGTALNPTSIPITSTPSIFTRSSTETRGIILDSGRSNPGSVESVLSMKDDSTVYVQVQVATNPAWLSVQILEKFTLIQAFAQIASIFTGIFGLAAFVLNFIWGLLDGQEEKDMEDRIRLGSKPWMNNKKKKNEGSENPEPPKPIEIPSEDPVEQIIPMSPASPPSIMKKSGRVTPARGASRGGNSLNGTPRNRTQGKRIGFAEEVEMNEIEEEEEPVSPQSPPAQPNGVRSPSSRAKAKKKPVKFGDDDDGSNNDKGNTDAAQVRIHMDL